MTTAEKIILEIKELSAEERQKVVDFIYELDDDIGLEEDCREADKEYEEWKKTGEGTPAEDVFKRLGVQ